MKGKIANNSNSLPIRELDGNGYEYQSIKMMTLIEGKDLQDIMDTGYAKLIDWNTLDANAQKIKKEEKKKISLAQYHMQ